MGLIHPTGSKNWLNNSNQFDLLRLIWRAGGTLPPRTNFRSLAITLLRRRIQTFRAAKLLVQTIGPKDFRSAIVTPLPAASTEAAQILSLIGLKRVIELQHELMSVGFGRIYVHGKFSAPDYHGPHFENAHGFVNPAIPQVTIFRGTVSQVIQKLCQLGIGFRIVIDLLDVSQYLILVFGFRPPGRIKSECMKSRFIAHIR